MRDRLALWIIGLCLCNSGCALYGRATHNLYHETVRAADQLVSCVRHRAFARAAWAEVRAAHPELHSAAYARGFKEGYADYLEAGGTGNPPPLPPRHYWTVLAENPRGRQEVADWFAGFQHGALVAYTSGQRELVTVPSFYSVASPAPAGEPPMPKALAAAPNASRRSLPPRTSVVRATDADVPPSNHDPVARARPVACAPGYGLDRPVPNRMPPAPFAERRPNDRVSSPGVRVRGQTEVMPEPIPESYPVYRVSAGGTGWEWESRTYPMRTERDYAPPLYWRYP